MIKNWLETYYPHIYVNSGNIKSKGFIILSSDHDNKFKQAIYDIEELNILSDICYKYYHGRIHIDDIIKLKSGNYNEQD